ncbi:FliM/FliN family flagellar motor switch protein [Arvimicrobium flavum]|uniref:FliM/FliN family flagellar motor switch protein n=1 Tax=Arvimicrobium flavum TaxID=3393320 RepID=UPI00237B2700|nr:FliM/FliN family flagellar motor switch protein [Mesorhizobium shangrilense]
MTMASVGTPAETRDYILERLVGETGEPERVTSAARSMGERAIARIAEGLANSLAISLEVDVKRVDLTRFADARPKPASHAAVTVAASVSSPDALMMVVDAGALSLVVSTVFGADPDMPVTPLERDPSPIEIEVATSVFTEVATALNGHGPRALDIKFPLPAPVSGPDLKKLSMRDTPAVRIVFSLTSRAGSGEVAVVMPQRVLLKHRADGIAEGGGAAQNAWGARFGEQVMRSNVEVVATMPIAQMTLGELSTLAIGQVVPFDDGAQANVRLAARDKTLFTCEFGRVGQNLSVRVREPFETGHDIIDGLLPANRA